jgi:hypothetical protein
MAVGRGVHGEQDHHLEHVILYDVAYGTYFFIKTAATFNPEAFAQGDLDPFHIIAVPDRFQEGVSKAEIFQVLDRFLPEVVVDAKDGSFGKKLVKGPVELLGGGEVAAKGLLHNDAGILSTTGLGQSPCHGLKLAWWDGEVMQRSLSITKGLS